MRNNKFKGINRSIFFLLACILIHTPSWADSSEVLAVTQSKTATVTGVITDDLNEPLIGVAILVQGTTTGTVTNMDGQYTLLNLPSGDLTLEFTYVGFDKKTVHVAALQGGETRSVDVIMSEGVILDEVTVTALGLKEKISLWDMLLPK